MNFLIDTKIHLHKCIELTLFYYKMTYLSYSSNNFARIRHGASVRAQKQIARRSKARHELQCTGLATRMASDPPALVFPRPRTLEVRRMEVLEAQVRELRAEVRSLKAQLHAALAATTRPGGGDSNAPVPAPPATTQTPPAPPSNGSSASTTTKKRKRATAPASPTDTASAAVATQETSAQAPEPDAQSAVATAVTAAAVSAAAVAAVSAAGASAHSLVQTTEFRETRTALGVTGRKLRQRSCKVCSVLRGDRKRAYETTFFCEECTANRGGGNVYLCDRVRQHDGEMYRGVTCSQIWHVLWDNGKALPVNGTTIRMRRTRKSEPEGSSSSSPSKEDKPSG